MRMSARVIGKQLGMTTKEVYSLLKDKGLLDGEPGEWSLTELGKKIGGSVRIVDNHEAGTYNVAFPVISWGENIFDILKKK